MQKELIIPDSGDGNPMVSPAEAAASEKELIIPDSGDGNLISFTISRTLG